MLLTRDRQTAHKTQGTYIYAVTKPTYKHEQEPNIAVGVYC